MADQFPPSEKRLAFFCSVADLKEGYLRVC